MNPLTFLLGQAAGVDAGNNIDVLMDRVNNPSINTQASAAEIDQYANMGLDNSEAIRQRNRALEAGVAEADRKGMFGVKGTLRDILGLVGDAFLIQSGNKAIYSPQREKEKLADAMAGATINPRAAQERAMGVDPAFATDFGFKNTEAELSAQRNQLGNLEFNRKTLEAAMARAGQMMAAATATGDPRQIEAANQAIQQLSTVTGIPVESLMTGGTPEIIAGREATANQNLRLPQQERMVGVAERNVAARERSVNVMADRLGLDRKKFQEAVKNRNWDEVMDMFDISMEAQKEQGRNSRAKSNSSGSTNTSRPTLTKKPPSVSNW